MRMTALGGGKSKGSQGRIERVQVRRKIGYPVYTAEKARESCLSCLHHPPGAGPAPPTWVGFLTLAPLFIVIK
jgi:hypothetical protein